MFRLSHPSPFSFHTVFTLLTRIHLMSGRTIEDIFLKIKKFAIEQNHQEMKNLVQMGYSVNLCFGITTPVMDLAKEGHSNAVHFLIDFYDGSIFDAIEGFAIRNDKNSQKEINTIYLHYKSPLFQRKLLCRVASGLAFGKHIKDVNELIDYPYEMLVEKDSTETQISIKKQSTFNSILFVLKAIVIIKYVMAGCNKEVDSIISSELDQNDKYALIFNAACGFASIHNEDRTIELVQSLIAAKKCPQKLLKAILHFYPATGHMPSNKLIFFFKKATLSEAIIRAAIMESYAKGGHLNQLDLFFEKMQDQIAEEHLPQYASVILRGFIAGCHFPQAQFFCETVLFDKKPVASIVDDLFKIGQIHGVNQAQKILQLKFCETDIINDYNKENSRFPIMKHYLHYDDDYLFLLSTINNAWRKEIIAYMAHNGPLAEIDMTQIEKDNNTSSLLRHTIKKYKVDYESAKRLSIYSDENVNHLMLSIFYPLWETFGNIASLTPFPKEIFWHIISSLFDLDEKHIKRIFESVNHQHYNLKLSMQMKLTIFTRPEYKEFKDPGTRLANNLSLL